MRREEGLEAGGWGLGVGTEGTVAASKTSNSSLQPPVPSPDVLHVVAGALFDAHGHVLIAQRPPGKHMAGGWEFPGGKVDGDETPLAALIRELREELNIDVHAAEPVVAYLHHYPDRSVLLDLWLVTQYTGMPVAAEGQPLRWVAVEDLDRCGLLDADRPMIEPLKRAGGRRLGAGGF